MGARERELCGSVKGGVKNPKRVWWVDKVKAAVRKKKAACKEVLAASDEITKQRYMKTYREENRKV